MAYVPATPEEKRAQGEWLGGFHNFMNTGNWNDNSWRKTGASKDSAGNPKRSPSAPGGARYLNSPSRGDRRRPASAPGGARYVDSPLITGGRSGPAPRNESGDPPLIPPAPLIDTTQSAPTPVVTRSRDETYNAFLQQYGFDGEKAKAAADTRGELGAAYRAGDPLAPLPDALRPGSEAYMQSEDMRIWAQANPELAAKLRPPTQAKIGGKSYSISEEAIIDTMDQNPGVDREQAISLIRNGGRQPQAQIGGKSYDIEESAIIDVVDQNPGMSRQQALDAIRSGNVPSKIPATRLAPTGRQIPNEAVDGAMEQKGLKPNQSVDMTRSEEPYAGEMTMGKRYVNPPMNRDSANAPLKLAAVRQWDFTGTQGGSNMQPSSGLNEATTLKAPLKWQQGNIHSRADEDAQYNDDFLTPDQFVRTVQEEIGRNLFGPDYRSLRSGLGT